MKRYICIIGLVMMAYTCFGQMSKREVGGKEHIKFPTVNSNMKLVSRLNLESEMIKFRCDPNLNEFVSDSLNARLKQSESKAEFRGYEAASDSLWIHIKDSYSWNIQDPLPDVCNKDVLKLLSKKESKYTKEQWELYYYLLFYSNADYNYIERYVYYQNIIIGSRLFQFIYHVTYSDGKRKIKLVDFIESAL